jgi:peptidoglycan/xylan/chitin deacetylase (PgdA/CDA1 family)
MPGRMIPHKTPFFLPLLYPALVWKIPTDKKELYLTFDDGPVNGPTDFVLEELAKVSARATFFCIGDNIRKHPGVFQKVIAAHHSIGNHTFNHLNGWTTKTTEYIKNVQLLEDTLTAHGQKPATLFRPPYGRITRAQIHALNKYRIVMWDVLSFDYNKNLSGESCLRKTIRAVRPGSIVVFHDSYKAEKNMTCILPRLISHFAEQGYEFKSIPG